MSEVPETTYEHLIRSRIGGVTYLALTSNLNDAATIAELHAAVDAASANFEFDVIVDLSAVNLVNSAGLEALLDIQDALVRSGGWLKLAKPNDLLVDVFEATGLIQHLNLVSATSVDSKSKKPDRSRKHRLMGDVLVEKSLVTPDQIEEAIRIQQTSDTRLGDVLVSKDWVSEREVLVALCEQLNLGYCKLRPGLWDPEIAAKCPRKTAERLQILPMFLVRGQLTVATADPQADPALREVGELYEANTRAVVSERDNVRRRIGECYGAAHDTYNLISALDDTLESGLDLEDVESVIPEDYSEIDAMASDSPVITLCNSIIQRAIEEGVSDIHLEPSPSEYLVRFRIDGVLYKAMTLQPAIYNSLVSRLKVIAKLDIAERRLPQDGRIQVRTAGRAVDLRFSSLPGLHGEKVVLRVLDKNRAILDVDRLGMTEENLETFTQLLTRSHGLVLVTGPTGSGKTTTLYAALNHLNTIEKNLVTIEDPVEYQMPLVNQNQVRDAIGLSFSRILRHVLRQDPDIVLVGEIRDRETAEIAVQAALTGHLVLSTLHTNDSISAVTRLIDMGVEPYLLSSALLGVVAQRLIRTICPSCRTEHKATPEIIERFGWQDLGNIKLSAGRGCDECYDSGYRGRLGVHEILPINQDWQRLIIGNPSRDVLTEEMKRQGIKTLFDDGLLRVLDGKTTIEEVSRVTY